jgi:NADH-quinone oxidoreductase subunit M
MTNWLTTILILVPIGGALLVALLPLPGYWLGSLASLVSLVEVGFWITSAGKFHFGDPALQLGQKTSWFSDLHVSYHVGQYAFSLWLVGMTVVVMAACVIYGWWAGRDRARAYFALMLLLTGAIVGVFTAQDLLLFYAFFEAMLIPLYVLIGVWGGPGRLRATLLFVVYTVVGSLLMLTAIVVYGLQQHTFDLTQIGQSSSTWLFLGFVVAFAIKSPLFPLHGWLPDAYRESPPEVAAILSGVVS